MPSGGGGGRHRGRLFGLDGRLPDHRVDDEEDLVGLDRRPDGSYTITDLGSTNGTFLNDERVVSRALLRAGDRLRLGNPGVELALVRMD